MLFSKRISNKLIVDEKVLGASISPVILKDVKFSQSYKSHVIHMSNFTRVNSYRI